MGPPTSSSPSSLPCSLQWVCWGPETTAGAARMQASQFCCTRSHSRAAERRFACCKPPFPHGSPRYAALRKANLPCGAGSTGQCSPHPAWQRRHGKQRGMRHVSRHVTCRVTRHVTPQDAQAEVTVAAPHCPASHTWMWWQASARRVRRHQSACCKPNGPLCPICCG